MQLNNQDKKHVQQTVNKGGHVDTNGMAHQRAEAIRAEEARLRAQQQKR